METQETVPDPPILTQEPMVQYIQATQSHLSRPYYAKLIIYIKVQMTGTKLNLKYTEWSNYNIYSIIIKIIVINNGKRYI